MNLPTGFLAEHFPLPELRSKDEYLSRLAILINDMIRLDFSGLINILYRMDISEEKVRQELEVNDQEDAGIILARLIVERELERIKARNEFKPDNNIPEEEKW